MRLPSFTFRPSPPWESLWQLRGGRAEKLVGPVNMLVSRLQAFRFLSTMQRYFGNARARVRSRPNWASSRESTSVDTRPRVTRVNS